ncbi:MAG: insulinase family protein, partial [Isosphaeraceae bacterium]
YRDVLKNGVTEDELTQAKNKVLSRSVLRSERPMGRLASLGFHWTYRREYLTVTQELDALNKVTLGDVRRVLDRWPLLPFSLVTVGPTTEVKPPF